ncbi:MAG TPA: HNH endonuclease [Anaerolineae bacterium]|nr:HNH endonuclease [Anaerolineae bacterium]
MPDRRVTPAQRKRVAERADMRCEYCRIPAHFAMQTFSVEHIIPRVKGGETVLGNLAFACPGCNSFKHTKTEWRDAVSNKIVPLYHPRRQKWADHFAWSEDHLQIIGLTAVGRVTAAALKLNRSGLVNLRRALYAISEHPPKEKEAS